MINGAHAIVFSDDAEADRAFLREVLGLPHVDAGHGWLIFGLPPSEIAVHPADGNSGSHELYLMCEDVEQLREQLSERGVDSSEVSDEGWGLVTQVTLPGGGKLGVYQPRHPRPEPAGAGSKRAVKKKSAAKKRKKSGKVAKAPTAARKGGRAKSPAAQAKKAAKKTGRKKR